MRRWQLKPERGRGVSLVREFGKCKGPEAGVC